MVKKSGFLIVGLLLWVLTPVLSQEYQILHVKGEIVHKKTGENLKPGDKISVDDEIQFKTDGAMAAAMSPDKGRYIIRAVKDNATSGESDLIYVLKSTISPVRGGMSTRAGGINNAMDLKLYFSERPYVWAGEEIRLKLSSSAFPMNDGRFFYLKYKYGGEEINKRLASINDNLVLNKSEVFKVDGATITPTSASDFRLYYYISDGEKSEFITQINFILIDQQALQSLRSQFPDGERVYYEMADVFSDIYGKCDPFQLRYNLESKR